MWGHHFFKECESSRTGSLLCLGRVQSDFHSTSTQSTESDKNERISELPFAPLAKQRAHFITLFNILLAPPKTNKILIGQIKVFTGCEGQQHQARYALTGESGQRLRGQMFYKTPALQRMTRDNAISCTNDSKLFCEKKEVLVSVLMSTQWCGIWEQPQIYSLRRSTMEETFFGLYIIFLLFPALFFELVCHTHCVRLFVVSRKRENIAVFLQVQFFFSLKFFP